MEQERRDFEQVAARWDENPGRVRLANEVADAMIRELRLPQDVEALDFGCGTGLLTLRLQPLVKAITGVDSSPAMLDVFRSKIGAQRLTNVRAEFVDFEKGAHVEGGYDLIVSSMVTHHIPDTLALFREWFGLLRPGGKIGFSDLDKEDGSFHGDNTGVFHLGFDREKLRALLQEAGFQEVRATTATSMSKEVEGQGVREFPIFLITATKGQGNN